MPPADISEVMAEVEELLDESIAPKGAGYVIHAPLGQATRETDAVVPSHWLDLSRIDFEALKQQFETGHKHIEVEKLRGALNTRLKKLVRLNPMRMDYYEQFQRMIDAYNAGAQNVDALFAQLVSFAQNLNEEEQRGIAENLSEEELAIFDLLTRPDLKLSKNEQERVRQVSRQLLDTLKAEYLVLDWRKHQKTRAGVQLAIEEVLDRLPPRYESDLYQEKCTGVYQHVYDRYFGAGKSVYGLAVGRQ
jgi:type I restriction enzyme R subunit